MTKEPDEREISNWSRLKSGRRRYLELIGLVGSVGIAGCSSGSSENTDAAGAGTSTSSSSENTDATSTGTGTDSSSADLKKGGHIRAAIGTTPQNISPYKGTTTADYVLMEATYDRLTTVNQDLELQPGVAKEWNTNEDATEWTFILQDDAKFVDGSEVLAEDVLATVEFLISDAVPAGEGDLEPLKIENGSPAVEVEDDKRITFELTRGDAPYPKRLAETGSAFNISPKNVLEENPNRLSEETFGSGPFRLSEFETGTEYLFEANDEFYIEGKNGNMLPYVDKMTWRILSDPISRVRALTDERVDALQILPPKQLDRVKQADGPKTYRQPSGRFINIVLNTDIEAFQSNKVRKAMKYAMNREDMLASISGQGSLGHHDPISPAHAFYAEEIDNPFGPGAKTDEAQKLLEEAGYGDGLELPTLYYSTGEARKGPVTQLFQQQMNEVGIEFEIQQVTTDTWLSEYWNKDDVWYTSLWLMRIEDTTIPLNALLPDAPSNSARWQNEEYAAALQKALVSEAEEERAKQLKKCQEINHNNGAWLHCVFLDEFGAANDHVLNYKKMPTSAKSYISETALTSDAPNPP